MLSFLLRERALRLLAQWPYGSLVAIARKLSLQLENGENSERNIIEYIFLVQSSSPVIVNAVNFRIRITIRDPRSASSFYDSDEENDEGVQSESKNQLRSHITLLYCVILCKYTSLLHRVLIQYVFIFDSVLYDIINIMCLYHTC